MRIKIPYKNIGHTIEMLQKQIENSLDFAHEFAPGEQDPKHLFHLLKNNTTYKNDPPGVELLQSFPSLINDNYWGIPGAGDCDCFTIAAVACCVENNIPVRIVIVGNSSIAPSHIYCEVIYKGQWTAFDLVNNYFGETKKYKYEKIINVY